MLETGTEDVTLLLETRRTEGRIELMRGGQA